MWLKAVKIVYQFQGTFRCFDCGCLGVRNKHWRSRACMSLTFGKTHTCSRSPMFVSNAQTTTVEASEGPLKLIYDFYGFQPHYYKQTWNGTGLPSLSHQVADLLQKVCAEIKACS